MFGQEFRRQVVTLLHTIIQQGERLMALGDDLKASLTATSGNLDVALTGIGALNTEVKDLIARLQPGDVVTQEMVDLATTVGTKTQAIEDALKAIPTEPTSRASSPTDVTAPKGQIVVP